MKKKLTLMIIILFLISIVFIVVSVYRSSHNKNTNTVDTKPDKTNAPLPVQNGVSDSFDYNQAVKTVDDEYPWYSDLPIENDKYRIVYDFNVNKFRIRLKEDATENQKIIYIQKAVSELIKIGVDSPVDYYVFDANGNEIRP